MKKSSLIIMLIFSFVSANAQLIVNGNFAINNLDLVGTIECETDDGIINVGGKIIMDIYDEFPNWGNHFGTPHFYRESGTDMYSDDIVLDYADGKSEGIYGFYPFKAGKTYIVHVGFKVLSNQFVGVVAGSGPVGYIDDCELVDCIGVSGYQGKFPAIYNLPSPNPIWESMTSSIFNVGDNSFTFTPTADRDWVMIAAGMPLDGSCNRLLMLDYVQITRQCDNDLYVCDAVVPAGLYSYAKHLYSGSQYCSLPMSQTSGSVTFEATKSVLINTNFLAEPGVGEAFIAQINEYACDIFPPWVFTNVSKSVNGTDEDNRELFEVQQRAISNVKVYPNPTGNTLYIEGIKEHSAYKLLSITGATVRSGMFHAGINELILNDLPSGMYLLHTGTEVIKVMKE